MKWLKRIFIFLFALYCIICALLFFNQEQIIFLPDTLPKGHQFRKGEEFEIKVAEDVSLNTLLIKAPQSKGVILYLHGNKGSNRRCIRQADQFTGNEHDILLVDYRGYGKSDGQIRSEAQLHADIEKVYDWILKRYQPEQISVIGYSLGTGMASRLAANKQVRQLLLVAPYYSLTDIKNRRFGFIPDFLLKYKLANAEFLANVSCPVAVFHGTRDQVIPFDSAERLVELYPDKITLHTLPGATHRGVIFSDKVRKVTSQLLR